MEDLDRRELDRYVQRVDDRFPLHRALLGGAVVDDARGAPLQRERGPEYVVVLVSDAFDGVPWLDRVHQASSLWDAYAMGGRAELHCYTRAEYQRKVRALPRVRAVARHGLDLTLSGAQRV